MRLLFTGVLLVQAFYQISCRHIENPKPEHSVSNEGIQQQLEDLLIPLLRPNDEDNVGNVLNIIPYADRKRLKGKQETPMTIILTTNLSKKGKKKGKNDVVIAVQTLNSYDAPIPGIESLLNLSDRNMTESVENSESVHSTAEITNDEILHDTIVEDETSERIKKHNAKMRHHHEIDNNKKEKDGKTPETVKSVTIIDNQHIQRRHQNPKHIEINPVRATALSGTDVQLSMEEQPSREGLTAELPSVAQEISMSEQASSVEHLDPARHASAVEEPSPMELSSTVEESSNIEQSSTVEKNSTAEEPGTLEYHNSSEELSIEEKTITEEQISAAEHQTTTDQPTAEQQSSSEQLNSAEQANTVESSNTEQPSTTSKSNTVQHQSTAKEPSTEEQPSTREEQNTVEQPSTAEQASKVEQNTAEQISTAEALSTAELINIAEQIVSNGKHRNTRAPRGQNLNTINQSTVEDSITSENSVKNEEINPKNLNLLHHLEDQLSSDLEVQSTEKLHTGETTVPWGQMSISEESTNENGGTLEVTSVLIPDITSGLSSEVTTDHPSMTEVTITRHTSRIEKNNLQLEPITPKPVKAGESTNGNRITSEVTQDQLELNGDIILEQYILENEPVVGVYSEKEPVKVNLEDGTGEDPRVLTTSDVSPEQLGLITDVTLREQHDLENNPEIAENTKEERGIENRDNGGGEMTADTKDPTTSAVTGKIHKSSTNQRQKPIPLSVEKPTAETPAASEVTLEELELINVDTMLEPGLVTLQDLTEEELGGTFEDPSISEITITKKSHRYRKKNRRKQINNRVEEPTSKIQEDSKITPDQLGLINGNSVVEQYILENNPLINEEIIADRTREEPEQNYAEQLIPNDNTIRDYDTYGNPIAEPAALSDVETSDMLDALLRQTDMNSLLNAQNDYEHLDSKTEPLLVVVPNMDKSVVCPDKDKITHNEGKRLRDKDIMKRLNWDSNDIPLDVINHDRIGKDVMSQRILNSKYILNSNEKTRNVLSNLENDIRLDNDVISRYDSNEILGIYGGNGHYDGEQRERLDNQEISKQIARERLTNINDISTKKSDVVKSYNLSFTFNKK